MPRSDGGWLIAEVGKVFLRDLVLTCYVYF